MKTRFILFSYFTSSLNLLSVQLGIFWQYSSVGEWDTWEWIMEKVWTASLRDIFALDVTQRSVVLSSPYPHLKISLKTD